MALRIQNNIAAINAQRNLNISNTGLSKSLERLSSGYRINRAADDAAGLAISQQFRAEIASFKVASRNAAEANSLLQVAEGALDQMGNILTRLKELATQGASGNSGTNIEKINAEANQLIEEFDRIATSTQYAGTTLLTGQLATSTVVLDSVTGADASGESGYLFGITAAGGTSTAQIEASATPQVFSSVIANLADADNAWTITSTAAATVTVSNGTITYSGTVGGGTLTITGMGTGGGDVELATNALATGDDVDGAVITFNNLGLDADDIDVSGAQAGTYVFSTSGTDVILTLAGEASQGVTGAVGTMNFDNLGISFDLGAEWDANDLDGLSIVVAAGAGGGSTLDFQIGAHNDADNRLSISLADAQAASVGLTADMLSTQTAAQNALDTIDTVIASVTEQRGNVGAYMNRLSYASSNLETTIENVQAAESVIRDVDMAAEMTTFVKNQILMQAGTAMLAQANMAPQSVLSLLG